MEEEVCVRVVGGAGMEGRKGVGDNENSAGVQAIVDSRNVSDVTHMSCHTFELVMSHVRLINLILNKAFVLDVLLVDDATRSSSTIIKEYRSLLSEYRSLLSEYRSLLCSFRLKEIF